MHTSSNILMIRPAAFSYNTQTAVTNTFQQHNSTRDVNQLAQQEFDNFVKILRWNGINIIVIEDTPEPHTPDSVFPNNWASYHQDTTVVLYPMYAANRREERYKNVVEKVREKFINNITVDFTSYEKDEMYLEGTGSLVLDRDNKIAYACLSARTNPIVLNSFCEELGYKPVTFIATDKNDRHIYHTNVMLCVADCYVVICMDSIANVQEQAILKEYFKKTSKTIIEISHEQMNSFAGNMLQVHNNSGEKKLVMSTQAYQSLTARQIRQLQSYNSIIHAPLYTIEQNGGGSARCMMAEIFLPAKQ